MTVGSLAAAVTVMALTVGRAGFRAWGRRLIWWRVGRIWYAVAILLPVLLVLVSGLITVALGAAAPGLAQLVLLTLLFHNSQGTFTMGSFGFTGAAATRVELVYFMVVVLAVLGIIALDRQAWVQGSPPGHRRRSTFLQEASPMNDGGRAAAGRAAPWLPVRELPATPSASGGNNVLATG